MEDIMKLYEELDMLSPGGEKYTRRALEAVGEAVEEFSVLDLGCGTGASAFVLAKYVREVTGVDLFKEFLERIEKRKAVEGITNIRSVQGSMDDLGFLKEKYDLIWSEGAIYNIGFRKGLHKWKNYLREKGYLVVSELVWTSEERSKEAEEYWMTHYPEVGSVEDKKRVVDEEGYDLLESFVIPGEAWEDYYRPVIERLDDLEREGVVLSKELVDESRGEAEFYRRNKDYYSYAFFIMRKR